MLRLIAVISMIIDHSAVLFIQNGLVRSLVAGSESYIIWNAIYTDMRTVGRMAFPIFAILLVQGYERTGNFRNYALRLFLLALISEFPFDWVLLGHWGMNLTHQNTVYTLLIALLTIKAADAANQYLARRRMEKGAGNPASESYYVVWMAAACAGCLAAHIIGSDYNWEGVILILLLYLSRKDKLLQCVIGGLWSIIAIMDFRFPYVWGYVAAFVVIYILRDRPPVFAGLRQKGGAVLKAATYLIYPLHFLVLWAVYCAVFMK